MFVLGKGDSYSGLIETVLHCMRTKAILLCESLEILTITYVDILQLCTKLSSAKGSSLCQNIYRNEIERPLKNFYAR